METLLEINLQSLSNNYNFLRQKIQPATKFMGVVKAFAYGSDSFAIAQKLQDLGADYLAVAYTEEGVFLRKKGIQLPIVVLHPQPIHFKEIIAHNLEPALYSKRLLTTFLESLDKQSKYQSSGKIKADMSGYPVHLKFNTGLNRLGFKREELTFIAETVSERIKVNSIFSHLAATEDLSEKAFTVAQINCFKEICSDYKKLLGDMPLRHILNTSGILNYPEAQLDMVRSGIGLYGFGNDPKYNQNLQPIASLKSGISQIHTINAGDSIGYNRGYISTSKLITATIAIGHADGIGRQYGNGNGFVGIAGKKAPIIGNVCMDMIMVDITDINCKEGDVVTIFDPVFRADSLAENLNSISYELITGISQRVPRRIIE